MIKAQELRIGNWVCIPEFSNGIISEISRNSLWVTFNDRSFSESAQTYEHIQPIPLTPEILEKAGFVKTWIDNENTRCWDYELNEFHLHVLGNDLITFMTRKINDLHQLQNLYFALTGEELNIEL